MSARRKVPLLVLLGTLLAQVAWILSVPAFRGYDEPDHVFRAAAVARGEWVSHGVPADGRGGLVRVPGDLIRAAATQCRSLSYNGPENCTPTGASADGSGRVGSGAARYHPAFYWLVGTVARPFSGATADYAMRLTAALLCALGTALAAWCLVLGSERRSSPGAGMWAIGGLALAMSPVLVYSTTLPAPNGIEMVAGLVLWTALLALGPERRPGDHWLVAWAALALVVLVTVRTLGPVLALLVILCVALTHGRRLGAVLRAHLGPLVALSVVTIAAGVGALAWILTQDPLGSPSDAPIDVSYLRVLDVLPSGLLQSVAAAPLRGDAAPLVVYPVYLVLVLALLVLALLRGERRWRTALVVAVVATQVLPLAVSAAGLRTVGLIWQGRYGTPFTAGVAILAAVMLGSAGVTVRRGSVLLCAAAYLGVQVVACASVIQREQNRPSAAHDPAWWQTSTPVVGLVALVGFLVLLSAVRAARTPRVATAAAG